MFGHSPGFGIPPSVIVLAVPLAAVHGRSRSTPGSTAARTRCSRRRPTSAPRPAARSRGRAADARPSILAGSIFTFSLTLGDYITVQIVGGTTQIIGNVVYRDFGRATCRSPPRYATVPIVIMVVVPAGDPAHRRAGEALMLLSRPARIALGCVDRARARRSSTCRSPSSRCCRSARRIVRLAATELHAQLVAARRSTSPARATRCRHLGQGRAGGHAHRARARQRWRPSRCSGSVLRARLGGRC